MKAAEPGAPSLLDRESAAPAARRRLVDVVDLDAGYRGRPVISALRLSVDPGDRIAIIGPNGCGKSTLLRVLTGEVLPTRGEVRIDGKSIRSMTSDAVIRMGVGYLQQQRNVFPTLTVFDNLDLSWAEGHPAKVADRRSRVLALFPTLAARADVRAGLLSGGQRQVLALAMALMRPSRLLLLDEPIAGVSTRLANQILEGLAALQGDDGAASIIVEHRLRQIRPWVTKVIIMVRGEIAEVSCDPSILADRSRLERHYRL